ncbi:MAG: gliding motility-associated C-terminal domain-containing protein, partial [Bacteroidota bacterium]
DDCSGIVHLGTAPICPVPDTFNNVGATTSLVFSNASMNIPACFTGGVVNRDVWFSFDVPASGDLVDFTLKITGINGQNSSLKQPQVAVYRGDCELDGLEILTCATSGLGSSQLDLDLLGLTPGLTYFLRISDWSASASPNSGDFVLCLKEYDPVFNMGEAPSASACAGTLFDSGGPSGSYSNSQNQTFTICPSEFHQCIFVNVVILQTEQSSDYLRFFAGTNTSAPSLGSLDGFADNVQLQVNSSCLTVQFTSDGSFTDAGFELTWQCSPDTCTVKSPTTCADPDIIASLPYSGNDLTTCFAGNEFTQGPCNDDDFLATEDYVFTYQSPGDECIAVNVTGSNNQTGVGIYSACPNSPAADCIAQAGGGFGQNDPSINAAFLATPGTYYIVVDNADDCTPFNIEVQQVTCPVVLPSAAFCEDALSLNGCGDLPAIVSVAPGEGDPGFINFFNLGCWGLFYPYNYTFFYFQAQADGEFGFVMQAADPDESSDIDFQVWGPISNFNAICNFAELNEPVRSSYGAGDMATGMANVHPFSGFPVTDVCEDAGGDDFVKTLNVQGGQYYLVLINDWGEQITSGAVSIDFAPTTPGVLGSPTANFSISPDTVVCPGGNTQLLASGAEVYNWFPTAGLSCNHCPNPIASPSQTTIYSVAMHSVCNADTLQVEVTVLQLDIQVAPAQPQICPGDSVQLTATSPVPIQFTWQPAASLSCANCPDPVANPSETTTYSISGNYQGCPVGGSVTVEVVPDPSVLFPLNVVVCPGESLPLNAAPNNAWTYQWAATDPNFVSLSPAPTVTPLATTTYYVTVSNGICPPVQDSVTIFVAENLLEVSNDTVLCGSQTVELFADGGIPGHYIWQPGGSSEQTFTPNLQSGVNLISVTFIDSAGCFTLTDTIQITLLPGIQIDSIQSDKGDTVYVGTPVVLTVETSVEAVGITWSSGSTLDTAHVLPMTPPSESYAVTVTDEQGCTDTSSISLTVLLPQFDIPNIFTPNNDGVNDSFKVIISGDNIEVLSMQIFNRWGQRVFESTNSNDGWDGRQDGEDAPSDVYVFVVEIQQTNGEVVVKKGDLTLAR